MAATNEVCDHYQSVCIQRIDPELPQILAARKVVDVHDMEIILHQRIDFPNIADTQLRYSWDPHCIFEVGTSARSYSSAALLYSCISVRILLCCQASPELVQNHS